MINCFLSLSPYLTVNTVYLDLTGELMHARRDNEVRLNFGIFISPFVRTVLILDCVLRVKVFYYLPAPSNQMWYGVTDWVTELAEYNRRSHVYISIILTKKQTNKVKQKTKIFYTDTNPCAWQKQVEMAVDVRRGLPVWHTAAWLQGCRVPQRELVCQGSDRFSFRSEDEYVTLVN
jgi:hypothetical protein